MVLLAVALLVMFVMLFGWIHFAFFSRRVNILVERKEIQPPPPGKQLVYVGGVMIGLPTNERFVIYAKQHEYPVDSVTYGQVEPGMRITLRQSRDIWRLQPASRMRHGK